MPYTAPSDTCILLLVRHAATLNNLARPPKIQGVGDDSPLSQQGRAQAARTAGLLRDQSIVAVFSSPLLRAVETAQIIAQPHGLNPTPIPALHEVNVGTWEGRSWVDIERDEPEAYQRFVTDPATYGYAGGENLSQVLQRVMPPVEQLMREHMGQVILLVGHNVVNRVLLAHLLHVPLAKARGIDQDNGGVNILRSRAGELKVLTTNAALHLH